MLLVSFVSDADCTLNTANCTHYYVKKKNHPFALQKPPVPGQDIKMVDSLKFTVLQEKNTSENKS